MTIWQFLGWVLSSAVALLLLTVVVFFMASAYKEWKK